MSGTLVVAIIGAGGSSSTTLAMRLNELGYNVIKSYTTREPRHDGEWGYQFLKGKISDNGKDVITSHGVFNRKEMISYFSGYENGSHYFATAEQVAAGEVNVITVSPQGASQIKEYFKDTSVAVKTMYLQVDEQVRAERLVRRDGDEFLTEEGRPMVWNRIKLDRKIFEVVMADYTINANWGIDRVVNRVVSLIECATMRRSSNGV